MSAQRIPQIASVMGSCTAGGAYVPAMSDETVIVRNQGTIFLGGPPLVKAATGEVVTAEELGGGDVHARTSGVVDHLAEDDAHALAHRPLDRRHPARGTGQPDGVRRGGADRGPRRSLRRGPGRHPDAVRRPRGRSAGSSTAADSTSSSSSTPRHWCAGSRGSGATRSASSPTTASCSASRRSRARTSSSCATSAASRWCSCRTSPASWSAGSTRTSGIAQDGAKLVTAVACSVVPKFTVVIGGSFGAGNYGMCGRAYDPRFLWMWPNARISVMGGEQAALGPRRGAGGPDETGRPRRSFKAGDPRAVRDAGLAVLLDRPALGRRHHRSSRHPSGARHGPGRGRRTPRSPSPPTASSGCERA